MKNVIDQAVLWIYCFIAIVFVPVNVLFVAAALAALLYACGSSLVECRWQRTGFTVIFLIFSFICPQLLLFTPLIIYGILEGRNYVLAAVLGGSCIYYFGSSDLPVICFIMIGCMIAVLIQFQTRQYTELEEKFRKTRDDGAERNRLLREKNQSILKKQDYEIYTATLKERNRIAREIHDNVGHMLSRSILMVGAMKAVHGEGPLLEPMEQLEDTLNAAMTSVRESVHDLHDESVNLKEVLESLVREFTFCSVSLEYDMGYDVPRELRYSFIAIVKEALHNVMRHSDASKVRITAREHPGFYQLIIEDNGTADSKKTGEEKKGMQKIIQSKGIGIKNMRERIDAANGRFEIQKEKGWRIYITVPKKAEQYTDMYGSFMQEKGKVS